MDIREGGENVFGLYCYLGWRDTLPLRLKGDGWRPAYGVKVCLPVRDTSPTGYPTGFV